MRAAARRRIESSLEAGSPASALEAWWGALTPGVVWDHEEWLLFRRYSEALRDVEAAAGRTGPRADTPPAATVTPLLPVEIERVPASRIIGRPPRLLEPVAAPTDRRRPAITAWTIPDAQLLFGRSSFLAVDANGVPVPKASSRDARSLELLAPRVAATKQPRHLPGRSLLVAGRAGSHNYSLWLLNHLTAVPLYERAGATPARMLVRGARHRFHEETLSAIRDTWTDVVEIGDQPFLALDELVVVSSIAGDYRHGAHHAASWGLDFLARRFDGEPGPHHRIYVSRADAVGRHPVDEPVLIASLARRGFVPVELRGRAVAEQAALFRGADVIVAVHGAGLANLAFARPGTRVLEIFPQSYGTSMYAMVAAARDLDYTAMVIPAVEPSDRRTVRDDDVDVDIARVVAWLAEAPASPG